MKRYYVAFGLAMIVTLVAARMASADPIPGFWALDVTVTAGSGPNMASETWSYPIENGIISANTVWDCLLGTSAYQLRDPITSDVLGTVTELSVEIEPDPAVGLHFAVDAGASNTPFTFTSVVVPVPGWSNVPGYATAALTVTPGGDNVATLTGSLAGGKVYEANYNGTSTFAGLLTGLVSPIGTSATVSDSYGAPISGPVNTISSQIAFTLSANDMASGTSRFQVTPEPASVTLLAIGGVLSLLAFAWQRRK